MRSPPDPANIVSGKGVLITIEGIDGAGKSGHISAITDQLLLMGHKVVITREPGGTNLAEKIRQMVLNDHMDHLTEALLMFAARRDHIQQIIRPALAAGQVVVCDRFTDSTFAYQGGGRQFDWTILSQLQAWVQGDLEPDLTLWFDLPPHVAAQRLAGARAPDRFEAEQTGFFQAVRDGYRKAFAGDHNGLLARVRRIDAEQPIEQVRSDVLDILKSEHILTVSSPQRVRFSADT